jgi:hypothetical protein
MNTTLVRKRAEAVVMVHIKMSLPFIDKSKGENNLLIFASLFAPCDPGDLQQMGAYGQIRLSCPVCVYFHADLSSFHVKIHDDALLCIPLRIPDGQYAQIPYCLGNPGDARFL